MALEEEEDGNGVIATSSPIVRTECLRRAGQAAASAMRVYSNTVVRRRRRDRAMLCLAKSSGITPGRTRWVKRQHVAKRGHSFGLSLFAQRDRRGEYKKSPLTGT